jgi:translation initiation factor 6
MDIMGSPNIGVYMLATNSFFLTPLGVNNNKIQKIKMILKGDVVSTNIGGSRLIGVLAAANSNGLLLPYFAEDEEIKAIKSVIDLNVERVMSKRTALGNLILVNDYGAFVDADLLKDKDVVKKIEDVFDVEPVQGKIADLRFVGSLAVSNNKGTLAHPLVKEDETTLLKEVLKVNVDVGTVNFGVPFVASGLVVNENGALIGNLTTGPEIVMITNLFG